MGLVAAAALAGRWVGQTISSDSRARGIEQTKQSKPTTRESEAKRQDNKQRVIDLEEVWETDAHVAQVPIKNQASEKLVVGKVNSSCGCTHPSPLPLEIDSYGEGALNLTLDLTQRVRGEIDRKERIFATSIQLMREDGGALEAVILKATVKSRATLNDTALHFGDSCIKGSEPVERRVRMTSHTPAHSRIVQCDVGAVNGRLVTVDEARGVYELFVQVNPSLLEIGSYATVVKVYDVAVDGERSFACKLPVTFEIAVPRGR